MSSYRSRKGARIGHEKAGLVAQEMTRIDPEGEGVTGRTFHLSQRPENAPLHEDFEWDDSVAGLLYRDEQGRNMIRSVYYVAEGVSGEKHTIRAFLAVSAPPVDDEDEDEDGPADTRLYKPTEMIFQDDDESAQIIEDARRQLKGWRDRWTAYADVHERFQRVFSAITEVLAEAAD